jgi:hypothetical protein
MTAAGVQNLDSTAYVPPSPSASTPDTKGTGLAGKPSADPQAAGTSSEPSDFRNELEQQQTGANETKPGSPKVIQEKTGQEKTGPEKSGSGKTGKKRDTQPEGPNVSVVTPAQVADPQKPILPFTWTLAQVQENAQPDAPANVTASLDDHARPTENPAETVLERAQAAQISLAAGTAAADSKPTTTAKQSPKLVQSVARVATADVAPSAMPDSSQALQLASGVPLPAQLPWQVPAAPQSDQASPGQQDQNYAATSSKTREQSQPVSPTELNLPAAPPEPLATAIQETADSTPSSPSALAFAARMASPAAKTNPAVASNAAQILSVPGPQTPAQIPVRYAAMAQIIQSAVAGNKEGESKKDPGAVFAQLRADARSDIRIDLLAPQAPTAGQQSQPSASSSTPEAPQPPAPTAQLENVIEPPAAPPTSNHDIRVRVPDNNGGSTQVRFVESGGEVRVSVRTADEGLAQNLRTHLNDLTQRLSDGGMPAEIWKPASTGASSQNDQHPSNQDGRGSGGQGSGGQGGQQDRQQKRPAWLEEMEASLHSDRN